MCCIILKRSGEITSETYLGLKFSLQRGLLIADSILWILTGIFIFLIASFVSFNKSYFSWNMSTLSTPLSLSVWNCLEYSLNIFLMYKIYNAVSFMFLTHWWFLKSITLDQFHWEFINFITFLKINFSFVDFIFVSAS